MAKLKTGAPILLAFVIAVCGSLMLYKWLEAKTAPKETVQVTSEAVPVCVAAVDLAWGTKLTPEMLKTVPFLKESLPSGYYSNALELEDRVVLTPLKANDPVIEHRLAPADVTTGGVSAIVSPGKRAIAVKGDKVIGLAGFISPMNRVDVLVTMEEPRSKSEVTKMVLENVLVLATGTQMQKNEKGEPAPVDVYTLEVLPEEGEKLALAATKGKVQLALRNATDSESILTKGATVSETLASLKKAGPAPVQKEGRKWVPRTHTTVEVIKGSEMAKQKLQL
jgi:pilus assembly protein CpaB